MTPLAELLTRRIAATGPITLADYMAECLWHPDHGYYATRDPFGAKGDFTTAPEISQMFGECLGLALAQAWADQGGPKRVILAELGPGRGTLMADVLRAAKALPAFRAALEVHLVEASPVLRARQAEALADTGPSWHDTVQTLPEAPLFLLANEFFDALPIRQFLREGPGWRERQVGLSNGQLSFGLAAALPIQALAHRLADTSDGDLVELCPALPPIITEVARRIATHGGAAILIDYGGWNSLGDTFQALRAHAYDDPLAHPGEADLTAHVDFAAIARAAAPAGVSALVEQGTLLDRLGITARSQVLAQGLAGERLAAHLAALRRLTHAEEMGRLFKAIAIHPRDQPPPPGFS